MKKYILIVLLIVIIFINPKKITSFKQTNNEEIKTINEIELNNNVEYVTYKDIIVYYDKGKLTGLDTNGKELFKVKLGIEEVKLEINGFIDVLDKTNDVVYSVDENGNVVMKNSMKKGGLIYKSISNQYYLYAYESKGKNSINIYDEEFNMKNNIEVKGLITDIEYDKSLIYVSSLDTEKDLKSIITTYDYNGNLKSKEIINESIIIDNILYKNNIYTILDNKLIKFDRKLNKIEELKIDELRDYEEVFNNGLYILDGQDKIKHIKDNIEDVKISVEKINGLVGIKDEVFVFKQNIIYNNKGIKLKEFSENINNIIQLNDGFLLVELESSIKLVRLN